MPVTINFWAVLAAAVLSFVIGGAWYSPSLFAKPWLRAINHTPTPGEKQGMGSAMVAMFVSLLVTAYVLAHFTVYAGANTVSTGAQLGFWVWLGFTAMFTVTTVVFERLPWALYWITNGYQLISLVVMSIIVAVWR